MQGSFCIYTPWLELRTASGGRYVTVDTPGDLERMQTHVKRMKSSACNSAPRIRKTERRHVGGHRSHQSHIYRHRSISPLRQRSKLIEWSSNNRSRFINRPDCGRDRRLHAAMLHSTTARYRGSRGTFSLPLIAILYLKCI